MTLLRKHPKKLRPKNRNPEHRTFQENTDMHMSFYERLSRYFFCGVINDAYKRHARQRGL